MTQNRKHPRSYNHLPRAKMDRYNQTTSHRTSSILYGASQQHVRNTFGRQSKHLAEMGYPKRIFSSMGIFTSCGDSVTRARQLCCPLTWGINGVGWTYLPKVAIQIWQPQRTAAYTALFLRQRLAGTNMKLSRHRGLYQSPRHALLCEAHPKATSCSG